MDPSKSRQFIVVYLDEPIPQETPMYKTIQLLARRCKGWEITFAKSEHNLKKLSTVLDLKVQQQGYFCPLKNNIFKAFELTPLNKVRIVIVGQDPYPHLLANGNPMAQGLSFSVDKGVAIPSSLANIFKEIKSEYPEWQHPGHGDLTSWAKQGVLMLNICLTCPPGVPKGHKKEIWEGFISTVLKDIAEVRPNCIYVMWGRDAQSLEQYIGQKSIKLTAPHPSGLSAYRGFFGCNHFLTINQHLIGMGEEPIIW
jgi:uracil-DNA glycosylase